ncbi:MAG: hypothetical protein ACD_39C00095G0003 [uncultured bacterium]|nr:MAG: hypothetical protein ACD_39C00095G0003 [uncultured bacterium]
MKKAIMVLALTLLAACVWADSTIVEKWSVYKGAWFEILYPGNFWEKPSLKDRNNPAKYSSVFFVAPEGNVEFYVMAPKYGMEPVDIALSQEQEIVVAESKKNERGLIFKDTTICAKDGSYMRLIEDYTDTTGPNTYTRRTFSIKYKNQKVFNEYRAVYEMFKNSLMKRAF